tara:strand:+ start:2397 stop:2762 length:366 start_codon:yes stop_codon:yes gene_type:complete
MTPKMPYYYNNNKQQHMRKIEQQMNDAIRQGRNFSSSNTSVQHDGAETFVYLHGNHIATVRQNSILLFDGGWQSNTTKSRLNALLDEFSYGARVFQRNFEWFVGYKNLKEDFVDGFELAIS